MNLTKKESFTRYICVFCLCASSYLSYAVIFAFSTYYVAFQEATGYSNVMIGLLVASIGISKSIANVLGGFLGDRFKTVPLTMTGLIASACVGMTIALFPPFPVMVAIYAVFILFGSGLAWESLLKMLRMLGTDEEQAKIQTVRTWGRNICALLVGALGVVLIVILPTPRDALVVTYIVYCAAAIVMAIIAYFTFKSLRDKNKIIPDPVTEDKHVSIGDSFRFLAKHKSVWLVAFIGFCAYTASSGITYLQPFMSKFFGLDLGMVSLYGLISKNCAILSAPLITFVAAKSRTSVTKALGWSMGVAAICFVVFIFMPQNPGLLLAATVFFMIGALCIYGAWGMQFTPVSEVGISLENTALAIGTISIISYCSDFFWMTICGGLIDSMGLNGYLVVFGMIAAVLVVGVFLSFFVAKKYVVNNAAAPKQKTEAAVTAE